MSHLQVMLLLTALFAFICLASFFSFAETSIMAVNRYRLRHKARLKKRYAMRALQLLKRPDRTLGTILIGNTVANMLASSVATLVAMHFWGEKGALLVALCLTFMVLIFAEILPKTLAALYPDKIVKWIVYPIVFFLKVLSPLVVLTSAITRMILRLFHISASGFDPEPLSREELRSIVYDTTGKISKQYQNMLLTILDLTKLTVDDVMVPKHNMPAIDIDASWEVILTELNKTREENIPIYQQQVNQIVGVCNARDLLRLSLQGKVLNKEVLLGCLKEPYYVPSGTALNIQLNYFQQMHEKAALVVDEYGELLGFLTLNDILEEIVGDFSQTLSTTKQRISVNENGSYRVDGSVSLREFNRYTGWELPIHGPRTMNGLIVEYLEMLPKTGVAILINGYPVEITEVKENRVQSAIIFPPLTRAVSE